MVRHAVDLNSLPPLTEAQVAELTALAKSADGIDLSDIPEMTDEQFEAATKIGGRFNRPLKKPV